MKPGIPFDDPPTEAERAMAHRVCADVLEHLRAGLERENVVRLVTDLHSQANEWIGILRHHRDARKIACAKGCAWCCYINVDTSVPEVIRLVEFIRSNFTEPEIAALRDRVMEAHHQTIGLTPHERVQAHVACPLLGTDGSCSVYQVRPLACRTWNSFSATKCKQAQNKPAGQDDVPQFLPQIRVGLSCQMGIVKALEELGLRPGFVGLISALNIALNDPGAADVWLSGGDAFAVASAEDRRE